MLEWLQTFSNFVLKSDQTLFAFSENDKGNEFKHIRQALVDQRRLRLASLAMLFELKHTKSGAKLKESVDQAFSLCELLEKQSRAPATFRSVLLKTRLAGILKSVDAQRATDISAECTTCLTSIARPTYSSWGEFYPSKALDDEKASIVNSEMLNEEKCDKLLALCKTAVLQENITKANQIYMTARDVAYGWLQSSKGHDSEKLALQKLRTVQEENINFHENHGLAFYLATAIADYLTFLCYRFYDYVAVIEKVEGFERKCPDFAVPNLLEQLYRLAATAAAKRDMKSEQRSYSDKLDDILQKCSFSSDTGGLTDEAILDPDFTHRALSSLGDNLVSIGDKSLELMLRWAGFEWEKNLLSADECTRLFGLADLPQTDVANHLRELDCPELAKSMLGDANTFIESEQFLEAYGRILRWILLPDRLPSRAARLSALKVMLESRLDRVRQFLRKYRELPRYSEAITIEEESSALRELEHLEAAENGMNTHPNRDIEERIQKILVRSYLPALPGAKLEEKHVTDAELETASAECRTLIVSYRDSGYRLNEYQALCQLLRIWWQRHLMFKTVSLEQFLEIVKEAETSFLETKAAIGAADPPEDLMARVKLSTDFGHREHYNYALSATLTGFLPGVKALQSGRSASLAFNSYQSFLFWSLRSKGRAFDDILNLETEVIRTETSPITNRDLPTKLSTTSIQDAEPGQKSIANPVVPMRLSNMLQNLPTGVVIVDFLEVRYAWSEWPLVAMLYRKGQMNFPVRIRGLDMADIKIWVKTNLEKGNNLRGTDSLDIMNELAALLEPLMKASPKSVGNPIQDGETMIICPTGALSRVPIHAIPVNGRPLIERNPVVYCQSLSVLHWLWCKTEQHKLRTRQNPKRTVIHPLPDDYVSTPRMEALSQKLKAHYHHGSDLKTEQISGSISGSALLHYHGIVLFNTQSALDSAMILNERAKSLLRKSRSGWHKVPSGCEVLTPRGIFKVKLDAPALACIIGPKSNMSDISRGDDVLGLPTAMFYAGATGVISTLGQIDDEDGAAFAKEFYDAIWEQKDSLADGSGSVIDLAKAMQAAILRLRSDPAREHRSAAYHWASYILNGFWLLPSDVFTGLD